jgi:prepilin-type N-terminal cleavage/methylation domain-containing protein
MKFPRFSPPKASSAFTLIELLIVIAIIAILIGLLFPAFAAVKESARKTQAKNDEVQIVSSVKNYMAEYGKYPVDSAGTSQDSFYGANVPTRISSAAVSTNDKLFDVLRNNTASVSTASSGGNLVTTLNPRQVVFMELSYVKIPTSPTSGVVPKGVAGAGVYYDPWGSPYNVFIDANYDNQLINPYGDATPPGGDPINQGVIVFAYGKNGLLGGGAASSGKFSAEPGTVNKNTNSGDVISWQ